MNCRVLVAGLLLNGCAGPSAEANRTEPIPVAAPFDTSRERTSIHTKTDWETWPFFDRLKRHLKNEWRPDVSTVVVVRETVLRIQLKLDGSVASVTIEKASGVEALDEEAVRAVKAAAPYADGMPAPAKLMNAAGLIEFRMALVVAPKPPTADKK